MMSDEKIYFAEIYDAFNKIKDIFMKKSGAVWRDEILNVLYELYEIGHEHGRDVVRDGI